MSLYRDGRRIGDYLALNISSGGALLANGPQVEAAAQVQCIVRLHGACTLHLDAVTLRSTTGKDRDGKLAITFRRVEADREDLIHGALLEALERSGESSILIVHRSVGMLAQLAEAVAAVGRRPMLAYTPLDAILWLCDPDTKVDAALIDAELDASQGATLLQFLKDEFPSVRRVVVHGDLADTEIKRQLAEIDAQAAVSAPLSPSRLRAAIQNPGLP